VDCFLLVGHVLFDGASIPNDVETFIGVSPMSIHRLAMAPPCTSGDRLKQSNTIFRDGLSRIAR